MTGPGDWREEADRLARQALADDEPTAWFDRLYRSAAAGVVQLPWEHDQANTLLSGWLSTRDLPTGSALVIGAGLGADAEHLAGLGHITTAIDVSPTAVQLARARHPGSRVEYVVADLLALPSSYDRAFDLVVEVFTVQALPLSVRSRVTAAVAGLLAPGGTLLVVQFQRPDSETDPVGPPWPLSRADIEAFTEHDLALVTLESLAEPGGPTFWRAELTRS